MPDVLGPAIMTERLPTFALSQAFAGASASSTVSAPSSTNAGHLARFLEGTLVGYPSASETLTAVLEVAGETLAGGRVPHPRGVVPAGGDDAIRPSMSEGVRDR